MSVARTLEELLGALSRRVTLIERRLAVRGTASGGGTFILPERLEVVSKAVTDLNDANENGWYYAEIGAANSPVPTLPTLFEVKVFGGTGTYAGRISQEAVLPVSGTNGGLRNSRFMRLWNGSGWSVWRQTIPLSGVLAITTSGGAIYKDTPVTFVPANHFITPPNVLIGVQVNTSGNSLVSQAQNVTTTGFTARTATTQATSWTATYNVFWIAQESPA